MLEEKTVPILNYLEFIDSRNHPWTYAHRCICTEGEGVGEERMGLGDERSSTDTGQLMDKMEGGPRSLSTLSSLNSIEMVESLGHLFHFSSIQSPKATTATARLICML